MRPVTERSAIDLAAAIRRRELTSAEVVEAHLKQLARDAPRINAIVADRFDAARAEAEQADRLLSAAGLPGPAAELPPLLGVPFTVKETIELQGMPNSAG